MEITSRWAIFRDHALSKSRYFPRSEPEIRSMSGLQDQILLGIKLSFLQIRCIRECKVKGEKCNMDYNVNSVACEDPNACKDWYDYGQPECK